jgi:4-amino-4-deoxy-L-arabinose transferase-like glycosyltransferase
MGENGMRWGLGAILAAFSLLGVLYSAAVPLFEAPDEIWHFSFVNVLATEGALPVQPTDCKDMWLRESGQPPVYHVIAALLASPVDTSDFPGFVRFNDAHPAISPGSPSTAPNIFIHTAREAFPYSGSVLAAHMARLLSVVFGAGTVAAAFLVAREVMPSRPGVALASASVAAFNPQFIFISSVVNNDAAAACLSTLALWLAIRSTRLGFTRRRAVGLGVIVGLALLTKVSALALLAPAAIALLLVWLRERGGRALLAGAVTIFGLALIVAGWWYVRNWLLYGDPLAWRIWMMDIGKHQIGLAELFAQFRRLGTSFWSPYDGLFPPAVLAALGTLAALAAAGLVRLIVRRRERADIDPEGLVIAAAWLVILFVSVVYYMVTTPADQGRLLFPAIASSSLLLVMGWRAA